MGVEVRGEGRCEMVVRDWSNPQWVFFRDGTAGKFQVWLYGGAAMVGDPTAYVIRAGTLVWVIPGQLVAWMEA